MRGLSLCLLAACSAPPPADLAALPGTSGPPGFLVALSPVAAGYPLRVTVDGVDPGTPVQVWATAHGLGAGPCLAGPPPACLAVQQPRALPVATANAAGHAVATWPLPRTASGVWHLQVSATVAGGLALSPTSRVRVAARGVDRDGDGLDDAAEVGLHHTDPARVDTDGDGALDGVEVERGLDPTDPDMDLDGMLDGVDVMPRQVGPFDAFLPVDTVVSARLDSLPDPEFEPSGHVAWQHDDGAALWVAALDPTTGALVPRDGRGTRLATGVTPIGLARNGPEWTLRDDLPIVLFNKEIAGAWRMFQAEETPAGWVTTPISDSDGAVAPVGTLDPADPDPWVSYLRGGLPTPDVCARSIADPTTERTNARPLQFPRWIPGERAIAGVLPIGGVNSVVRWDPVLDTTERITQDAEHHGSVFFFDAPELGGEQLFFTTHGPVPDLPTSLVVWRQRQGVWEPWREIVPPAAYPYVVSPEPFTWNGISYASFLASSEPLNRNNGAAVVFIAALLPGQDLIRRVSDATPIIRKDPETWLGGARPWVYYSEVDPAGRRVLHRVEVGL
jgi:hypothetical protein